MLTSVLLQCWRSQRDDRHAGVPRIEAERPDGWQLRQTFVDGGLHHATAAAVDDASLSCAGENRVVQKPVEGVERFCGSVSVQVE